MKAFLFSYSPDLGTTDEVLAWLDKRIEIARWMTPPMPSSVIVLSDQSVNQLGQIIRTDFPKKFFLVIELSPGDPGNFSGSIPSMVWAEIYRATLPPTTWHGVFGPGGTLEKLSGTKRLE